MKLKKAIKIAKEKGYEWITVTEKLHIYASYEKSFNSNNSTWWKDKDEIYFIGTYTGNKHWKNTLREVK